MSQPTPFDFRITKIFLQATIDPSSHSVDVSVAEGDPYPDAIYNPLVKAGSSVLVDGTDYTWPYNGVFHLITSQTEPITATYAQQRNDDGYPASLDFQLDVTTHDISKIRYDDYGSVAENPGSTASITQTLMVQAYGLTIGQNPGFVRDEILYAQDVKRGQKVSVAWSIPNVQAEYPFMQVSDVDLIILGHRI